MAPPPPPPPGETARVGSLAPTIPPPTPVSLPARGAPGLSLPLQESHEGLETLDASDEAQTAQFVIDNGSDLDATSELSVVFRSAHQSERPTSAGSPGLVPAPHVGRSNHPPPPPAAEPSGRSNSERVAVGQLPAPPRLPTDAGPFEDFDDDVDTMVLQKGPHVDSLRPVEVRGVTHPAKAHAALEVPPRGGRPPWLAMGVAGLMAAGAIAAAAFLFEEEQGDLMIDVADQQCGVVDDVKVFVDDELVCTASPCTLRVARGGHVVQAQAAGYDRTEPEAVVVDPEVPTLHRIQFGSSSGTGIQVSSEVKGYSLHLDGKLIGELPQRVTGLSSGEHSVLISGGESFYAEEKTVTLKPDEVMVLDKVQLRPKTGTLVVADNSELAEAEVTLDGKRIELPFEGEVDASRRYHVVAKRAGYEDFETFVEFDASSRQKELNIQLVPKSSSESSRSESWRSEPSASQEGESGERASSDLPSTARAAAPSSTNATGKASLTLQSTPPSMVLLDGRPIGQTPKSVRVEAGSHSILFVHPTKGKARATAKLTAGQSKTLRARF